VLFPAGHSGHRFSHSTRSRALAALSIRHVPPMLAKLLGDGSLSRRCHVAIGCLSFTAEDARSRKAIFGHGWTDRINARRPQTNR
jgi:hypothetical protein